MTAEDDYPAYGAIGGTAELHDGLYEKMCAELDQLRGWKAEAIQVINMWEECYDRLEAAGFPASPGEHKSVHVQAWIERALSMADFVRLLTDVPRRVALSDLRKQVQQLDQL